MAVQREAGYVIIRIPRHHPFSLPQPSSSLGRVTRGSLPDTETRVAYGLGALAAGRVAHVLAVALFGVLMLVRVAYAPWVSST